MYKIIVVDDESLSLKRFEHITQKENRTEIVGSFSKSIDALEFVKTHKIDIAFLDIEMPSPNGLELAELLLEADPFISIVFVTAFDQYALQAFKAHAIGYLLKPLDIKDYSAQIDQIARTKQPRSEAESLVPQTGNTKLIVRCIGQFTCYASGDESHPVNFRTSKTAELFAFLVHHYDSPVSKYTILDALFPDLDDEKANKLFYVSCSYLRSALSKAISGDVIIRENDTYHINNSIIDCDYIKIASSSNNIHNMPFEDLRALSPLCIGEYLGGKAYEWAFETKAYIETLERRILIRLSSEFDVQGMNTEATQALEKYFILDPCNDDAALSLIKHYLAGGQPSKAKQVYKTYSEKLMNEHGLEPSDTIKKLIK